MRLILDRLAAHRAGHATGFYSVCSAHPVVLTAAFVHARDTGDVALVEATSNQVNQDGGYTGMTPVDFRDLVYRLADSVGLDRTRVLLGGDHLGPNCWQALSAEIAMEKSDRLIHDYVSAGFSKIHLDCSMACAGEPAALGDALIAHRSARLAAVAEAAWLERGGEPPVYIIGSEVPVPGGAHETLAELAVTTPEAALATVAAHREAFQKAGLTQAWERVVGLVVQPGVEFDHDHVIAYRPEKAIALSRAVESVPRLVYEAHSTDYQTRAALANLVKDHFAILKVGPAVTFALREALWALDNVVADLGVRAQTDSLRATVLASLRANPKHWQRYYEQTGNSLTLQLQYSLSDRIRYYWPQPEIVDAVNRVCSLFDQAQPPISLISQYLPAAVEPLREGRLKLSAHEMIIHHIRTVLEQYSNACRA